MDNTVGSLTQLQRSIIIGSLLGDGYLRIVPGRKAALLEINHAFSQKRYVDWKYNMLVSLCRSAPKARANNGKKIAYRFSTRQHQELTDLYKLFYRNGKKLIPSNLCLDPIMLAVWFMDDGSKCRDSDVYLNTQQFTMENQVKLLEYLNKLDLKASLNKDKDYYRIRFISSSIDKLKELVGQNIVPSMYYKISYNPVET